MLGECSSQCQTVTTDNLCNIFFFFVSSSTFSSKSKLTMAASDHVCLSAGCGKAATLQCPTCIKLKIEGSYFCSQECFKSNWVKSIQNSLQILYKLTRERQNRPNTN